MTPKNWELKYKFLMEVILLHAEKDPSILTTMLEATAASVQLAVIKESSK